MDIDWARTNFGDGVTNAPSISNTNNRAISHLFMDSEDSRNVLGIGVAGTQMYFVQGRTTAWSGSGLVAKPISDFFAGEFNNVGLPYFADGSIGSVRVHIHRLIPEPEEYALAFGLFALGFAFFHRRQQKKKRKGWGKI